MNFPCIPSSLTRAFRRESSTKRDNQNVLSPYSVQHKKTERCSLCKHFFPRPPRDFLRLLAGNTIERMDIDIHTALKRYTCTRLTWVEVGRVEKEEEARRAEREGKDRGGTTKAC